MDITDRKRAETEKEKLQAQLQQAMKMEAVGRLAGGVAHDFNNLLTVIMGYSELLLQKVGKESPMHREVEEIKRAGERAASLTQQLLAFSRKQIIEPKVVRLDLLVADMQAMCRPTAASHGRRERYGGSTAHSNSGNASATT